MSEQASKRRGQNRLLKGRSGQAIDQRKKGSLPLNCGRFCLAEWRLWIVLIITSRHTETQIQTHTQTAADKGWEAKVSSAPSIWNLSHTAYLLLCFVEVLDEVVYCLPHFLLHLDRRQSWMKERESEDNGEEMAGLRGGRDVKMDNGMKDNKESIKSKV